MPECPADASTTTSLTTASTPRDQVVVSLMFAIMAANLGINSATAGFAISARSATLSFYFRRQYAGHFGVTITPTIVSFIAFTIVFA
jgi:hypothetical protein